MMSDHDGLHKLLDAHILDCLDSNSLRFSQLGLRQVHDKLTIVNFSADSLGIDGLTDRKYSDKVANSVLLTHHLQPLIARGDASTNG
jgi:hypothetical protein